MAGRVRHPVDQGALERYISDNVAEIKVPIDLKQFGFGQSNPTYQITGADGRRFVMRKKPQGRLVSKTAHKVEREYRIIHALEKTDVSVPKAYWLCEDEKIIGTPFYVMEFLDGRIMEDPAMPGVTPAERTEMWKDAARTLAKLHRVKPADVGLEKFGKANGFYQRQIQTWVTICASQAGTIDVDTKEPVGKLPHFDEQVSFFENGKLQPKDRGTLIHGDYKIDNLMFHKTEPRVIGILDWEMSTIGHPLADLCNLITPYFTASREGTNQNRSFAPGTIPGLPELVEVVRWYAEVSGYDPAPELSWGMAFSTWRNAGICQGIAARIALRQASSEKARHYADSRDALAELAWELTADAKSGTSRL